MPALILGAVLTLMGLPQHPVTASYLCYTAEQGGGLSYITEGGYAIQLSREAELNGVHLN